VRDLQRLGKPSHVAKVNPGVVNQVFFYDLAKRPLRRPLLARRDGQVDVLADEPVSGLVLGPDRVLDEERLELLEVPAQLDDVVRVEARVDVKTDVDVRPDSVPHSGHLFHGKAV
jgi:hypothetical protein